MGSLSVDAGATEGRQILLETPVEEEKSHLRIPETREHKGTRTKKGGPLIQMAELRN
jgi:hypothetical protein